MNAASFYSDQSGNERAVASTVAEITGLDVSFVKVLRVVDALSISTAAHLSSSSSVDVTYEVSFFVQDYGGLQEGFTILTSEITNSVDSGTFTTKLQSNASPDSALT